MSETVTLVINILSLTFLLEIQIVRNAVQELRKDIRNRKKKLPLR